MRPTGAAAAAVFLLGLGAFGCSAAHSGDQSPKPAVVELPGMRLIRIQHTISAQRKITAEDRAFVVSMLDSSNPGQVFLATADLGGEMGYGLSSPQDVEALLLNSLESGKGSSPGWEFKAILGILGFDPRMVSRHGPTDPLTKKLHGVRRADIESLGPDTRSGLVFALSSRSPRDRLSVGVTLVGYRGLPGANRAWALHLVEGQLAKSQGNEKQAWEIARRTILARNP